VKKIMLLLILLILSAQFVFSGEVNVSSFIGGYTGYRYVTAPAVSNRYNTDAPLLDYNSLMFGSITRYGISYKISDDFSLYFLGLVDLGLYLDFTPVFSASFSVILGGEIKANYKKLFFGLGNGMSLIWWPPTDATFLVSSGYVIKPNLLLEALVITDFTTSVRLGFAFSIFK